MGLALVGILGWGIAARLAWKALGYQAVKEMYGAYYLWALVAGPVVASGVLLVMTDPISAVAYGPAVFYGLPFIGAAKVLGALPIPFIAAALGAFLVFDLWCVALAWGYRKMGEKDREVAVSRIGNIGV